MARFNSGRFDSVRSKYTVMVLLIFFCVIALLGSPLHAHDLESSHVDLDCIPCHLVDSKVGLEHEGLCGGKVLHLRVNCACG